MRFLPVIAAFLCGVLFAQTQESTAPSAELSATPSAAPSAAMLRARAEAEHIRKLVEAGALPRLKLEESEQALARLEDEEILQRTLYGSLTVEDLTEVQTQEMVEAARRQLNYQRQRLDAAKKLADEGVAARTSVTPVLEDFDRSGRTVDLAESRARLFRELVAMARSEAEMAASLENESETAPKDAERFDGSGSFTQFQLAVILGAYEHEFAKPLPVSAQGSTAFHRSLGFDHRGRVDVAVHPDQKEGVWLRHFLEAQKIPYFAFRKSIPGKATAAHIHIGPPSTRYHVAD